MPKMRTLWNDMMRNRNQHDVPPREDTDPGNIAEGDASLDISPPNVTETQPPAREITDEPEDDGDHPAGEREAGRENEPVDRLDSELDALRAELSTTSDRYMRLAAEFDNYRRRNERERGEAHGRAQAELAGRLLDALDDLERVSHHADGATAESLLEGVQLVERKLRQALAAAGLEPIDPAGEAFDPNTMEAVAMVPAESDDEDDTVSDVFQRGYSFKGQLIRPARVRVKKHG